MDAITPPETISYQPVGIVRSPYRRLEDMPPQSVAAPDVRGQIELYPRFAPGLADLEGFSHLHIVAHLHRGTPGGLSVVPFLDDTRRGIFATRSPGIPTRSVCRSCA